ncbi:MAG: hypothetical protein QOJ95_5361 [Mycobacterium sp.]|nr:hypothetical protein [Mycobacterium sp.]
MRTMVLRMVIAASLAVSGVSHANLYANGYNQIPTIGPAFLLQASVFFAVAALVLVGGPDWLVWTAAVLAAGALGAFVLSRTVGIAGFIEVGWDPAPHALLSVVSEVVTLFACAGWWFGRRPVAA